MTLEKLLIALARRWKLMVICVVLLGVGAYIGSRFMTPIYQSTALVQIAFRSTPNQSDYAGLLASDELVQTEATLATSDQVLRAVASHYPGLTIDNLSKEVTASPRTNTQLFAIDVQDPSPIQAATLGNDIANTLIQQQVQMQQQASAQTDSFLFLAQPAQPTSRPIRPNMLVNTAAGLLAGLLLGIALALLFEQLDTRIRTPQALTQLLGWPVLATIWQANPSKGEAVIHPRRRDPNVEAFRILRTNIGFSAVDKPLRTLVITSAMPRDGKSVVAANLAIFMAKTGKSTLLIDADLRRPIQHEQFGLPANSMGFSNAILAFSMPHTATVAAYEQIATSTTPPLGPFVHGGQDDENTGKKAAITRTLSLDPFVHAVPDIPNLCVMPSGPLPPNPPELLDSKAMQRFFAALASCGAEMVIFDAPPLLGLSDASILASKVDGTLVVIDTSRAKKGPLKQLKAVLEQSGANLLGSIVNKHPLGRDHTIYSYYYYSTGEQDSPDSHSRKNGHSAPVTSHVLKQPEGQSEVSIHDQEIR